jgi:hypothetical protein
MQLARRSRGKNGAVRRGTRLRPNESELIRNARSMSRDNDVAEFIEHMVNIVTSRDLSREARILVESKLELKRPTRVHKAREKKVKERERKARLRGQRALELRAKEDAAFCDPNWKLELEEHNSEVLAKRRKPWLELQLLWHRRLATEAKEELP